MSGNATPERCEPPRPVIQSLPLACKAAVEADTQLSEMNLSRWATSFQTSEETIRVEFEKALWEHTRKPVEYGEDGK